MDIDWSKAPEGATHKVIGGGWYKVYGDCVSFFNGYGEWHAPSPLKDYAAEWKDFIPKPAGVDEPTQNCAYDRRESSAKHLYCEINWNDGAAGWAKLLEARKDDYRKAIDAGWQQVKP